MRARRYTDKIQIWESKQVADGFGGTTTQEVMLFDKWANVTTSGVGRKFQQFGLNEFNNPVMFRVRKGNDTIKEKMFVVYQDRKFIIIGIENVDLNNREINIFCNSLSEEEADNFTFIMSDKNNDPLSNDKDEIIIAK